jgi:uncharacterized OB-fold protein
LEPALTVKEYLAALKENRLLGVKCRDCGFITAPSRLSCRQCGGQDTEAVELSGKGQIATFTSVYIPVESRRGRTPYLVVMVELAEGPWIMGNLEGVDPCTASLELIGRKVRLQMPPSSAESAGGDGVAPVFILDV